MDSPEIPAWIWTLGALFVLALASAFIFVRMRRLRTVFISYRRVDSAEIVGQLHERLRKRFGRSVFRDEGSIEYGENFRQVITRRLRRCDVILVVIGPNWLSCQDEQGAARLHKPDDIVRNEVAAALASGALVIPLLVNGARIPLADKLPLDLRALPDVNAMTIDAGRLDEGSAQLTAAILAAPVQQVPWMILLAHGTIALLVALFAISGGFKPHEITTLVFIVLPLFAATAGVTAIYALGNGPQHARTRYISAHGLWIPLGFTAVIALLIVLKASNLGLDSFESFKRAVGAVEILLGVHTGISLSSLFAHRSAQ